MILIDHPGDGEWIMAQSGGSFRPNFDHSLATHRGGELIGGFVVSSYMGNMVAAHMAGKDARWCSPDLMWMLFNYCFAQLKVQSVVAPVASDNHKAMDLNLRAGFQLEAVIRDAIAPGIHLMLLVMRLQNCRWLRILPKSYEPGGVARSIPSDGKS